MAASDIIIANPPEFDITQATRLPECARSKAAAILSTWEKAKDIAAGCSKRWDDARKRLASAQRGVESYKWQIAHGARPGMRRETIARGDGVEDAVRLVPDGREDKLESDVATARADVVRRQAEWDTARKRADEAGRTLRRLERAYHSAPAGYVFVAYEREIPAGGRKDVTGHVERLRLDIRALHADSEAVRTAPLPAAEVKKILNDRLDELAAQGAPEISAMFDGVADATWPNVLADVFGVSGSGHQIHGHVRIMDPLAMLAWLDRDRLARQLAAAIDEQADDAAAIGAEAREQRLAEIAERKLSIERMEEAAIVACHENGFAIERRPDADLRAIFNLADETPIEEEE